MTFSLLIQSLAVLACAIAVWLNVRVNRRLVDSWERQERRILSLEAREDEGTNKNDSSL